MKIRLKKMNNAATILISAITGLSTLIVFLLISSGLIVKNDYNSDIYIYLWYISTVFSGFTAGIIAGRLCKSKGIIWGSLSSLIVSIIQILILCIINNFSINFIIFMLIPFCVIPGALGGILSSNFRK